MQGYLSAREREEDHRNRHDAESAKLDEYQDHKLTKHRKLRRGIRNHKPRHTGCARRGEERAQERKNPPVPVRDREHEENRANQDNADEPKRQYVDRFYPQECFSHTPLLVPPMPILTRKYLPSIAPIALSTIFAQAEDILLIYGSIAEYISVLNKTIISQQFLFCLFAIL